MPIILIDQKSKESLSPAQLRLQLKRQFQLSFAAMWVTIIAALVWALGGLQ